MPEHFSGLYFSPVSHFSSYDALQQIYKRNLEFFAFRKIFCFLRGFDFPCVSIDKRKEKKLFLLYLEFSDPLPETGSGSVVQ